MSGNSHRGRRPTTVTLVGGAVFVIGIALTSLSWWFLLLVAAAAVVPGLLRELGVLKDQDEFQRQAARKAGYHAYLAGLVVTFVFATALRAGAPIEAEPGEMAELVLIVIWFTWFLSWLLAYWGPKRTASRLLYIFGTVWLLFNILANLSSFVALVMQSLLAAPFFALAWAANRWPRGTGIVLILTSLFFANMFDTFERLFSTDPFDNGAPFVLVLFIGPLLASGIALLRVRNAPEEEDDETEEPA
ncbi:MAG: hypothetical protein GF405_11075 [Candidatus Eisenbacteria bacterium]|nr:hypothetical protein [Candidatus Eisenbacteria bacterium]